MGFIGNNWVCKPNGKWYEKLAYHTSLYMVEKEERLEALSEKTGLRISTISNWCRGEVTPTTEKLKVLCDEIGVTVGQIVDSPVKNRDNKSMT